MQSRRKPKDPDHKASRFYSDTMMRKRVAESRQAKPAAILAVAIIDASKGDVLPKLVKRRRRIR